MFEKLAIGIGVLASVLSIRQMMATPPVPRCPKCNTPQNPPPTRYGKCPKCGQIMDWRVKP